MVRTLGKGNGHRDLLRIFHEMGYPDDHLRMDFPVWLTSGVHRVDVAAFGRPHSADTSTATMIGQVVAGQGDLGREISLDAGRSIAAPAAILSAPDEIELWAISSDPAEDRLVTSTKHDQIADLVGRFRSVLGPDSLLAAKRAGRQLSLFPVDVRLLSTSKSAHSSLLSERIERAILPLVEGIEKATDDSTKAKRLVDASRIVVASLAALVVRDKFELQSSATLDVFQTAAEMFPGYFDLVSDIDLQRDEVAAVVSELGEGINYQSLNPGVISDVYEDAILTQSERSKLGIFYTPSALAKRIAEHLPFEAVAPDDRVTLDPACGSGTLLLAAHDRLESLSPADWDIGQGHDYLRNHLVGFDTDQFAVEIARLALLLNALPAGNSWKVERRDSPASTTAITPQPNFILSNPPWKDMRSKGGKRRQMADDFVDWMMRALRPGGHLAVVLPVGWLTSDTSRSVRERLEETLDVYEVWRLPAGTFASAGLGAAVIFGSKQSGRSRKQWVFRRVIDPKRLAGFYRTGAAQETLLASPDVSVSTRSLLRGPLDLAADRLRQLPALGDVADLRSGPVPEPPVRERGGSGQFHWLRKAGDLPAFGEASRDALLRVRFPEDFHRAGTHDGSIYRVPKVLVSAKRSPDNPWRLKPSIDSLGIIPRESLYMVTPAPSTPLHGLLAYLASSFASCWVDQQVTKMAIDSDVLRGLPVPAERSAWDKLDELGRRIVALSESASRRDEEELSDTLRTIDSTVSHLVGIDRIVQTSLRNHFAGAIGPEGSVRYPSRLSALADAPDAVGVRRFGAVLDVEKDGLRVWVPGVTSEEGGLVGIPNRMQGWLVAPGASFEVETLDGEIDWDHAQFHFQTRSYMSDEELERSFEIS